MNIRKYEDNTFLISIDETTEVTFVVRILDKRTDGQVVFEMGTLAEAVLIAFDELSVIAGVYERL